MITSELQNRIDGMVKEVIPIYTMKNPNPRTGRGDCPLTKQYKELKKSRMKNELIVVIDKYHEKTKDL